MSGINRKTRIILVLVLIASITAVFNGGICFITSVKAADYATYYIALNGNDNNPGTQAQPFRTIEKTRDIIRAISSGMTGDIIVYIRGGDYYLSNIITFDERDSGKNGYIIRYTNYQGENVRIIGGEKLTGSNWQLYSGNIYRYQKTELADVNQLFENGKRAIMAREPDMGITPAYYYNGAASTSKRELFYANNDQSATADYSNAQLYYWPNCMSYSDNWITETQPISSIDHAAKRITVPNDMRWLVGQANYIRYWVQNVLEYLDTPGEFYIDKINNYIYYWPENTPIANQEIIIPKLNRVIELKGTSASNPVENINFEGMGLSFEVSQFPTTAKVYLQNIDGADLKHGLFHLENAR